MEKKSFQQFKNYKGKPSPDGFPENDPAELGPDGFHPQYGKTAEIDIINWILLVQRQCQRLVMQK